MTRRALLPAALGLATLLASAAVSADISRTEVIDRAKGYAFHPWRCTAANLTASCISGYESLYVPGDYLGVAYKWGGFSSLFQFDEDIAAGEGAGDPPGGDTYSCVTGVDCSGYVSQCWHTSGKYGTSTISDVSSSIAIGSRLPGDAFNQAGYHITLYSHTLSNGEPFIYEAAFFNAATNAIGGWSYLEGYTPIRYDNITGTTAADPVGTLTNPILVDTLPTTYTDTLRNTADAPSDILDGCGLSPDKDESGREYIYEVHVPVPGQLTATITEDDGTMDVDVHLFETLNTSDCIARDDESLTHAVDCGTYYVVVDTFRSATNGERPGPYDLMISLSPSGGTCGSGPPTFDYEGDIGDACAFEGNPDLPYCNTTFDAVCIYTTGTNPFSFCSLPCDGNGDCDALPGGGCCEDLGDNEYYCLVQSLCSTTPGDPDAGISVLPDASTSGSPDAAPGTGGPGSDDDAGIGADDGGGGGCQTQRGENAGALWLLLGALVVASRRRRRVRPEN